MRYCSPKQGKMIQVLLLHIGSKIAWETDVVGNSQYGWLGRVIESKTITSICDKDSVRQVVFDDGSKCELSKYDLVCVVASDDELVLPG